jgi:hypothetical protein
MIAEFNAPSLGKLTWELPQAMVDQIELLKKLMRDAHVPEDEITRAERLHLENIAKPLQGTMSLVLSTQFMTPDLQAECFNLIQRRFIETANEVRQKIENESDHASGAA